MFQLYFKDKCCTLQDNPSNPIVPVLGTQQTTNELFRISCSSQTPLSGFRPPSCHLSGQAADQEIQTQHADQQGAHAQVRRRVPLQVSPTALRNIFTDIN